MIGDVPAAVAVYIEGRCTWMRPDEAMSHWHNQCLRCCCGMGADGRGLAELEEGFMTAHPNYAVVNAEERHVLLVAIRRWGI